MHASPGAGSGATDLGLTGSAAIDLGTKDDVIGSVAGFINGFGLLGAVIEVRWLAHQYRWLPGLPNPFLHCCRQGPLIALAAAYTGRIGVTVIVVLLVLSPIVAVGRAKKMDQKQRLPTVSKYARA